MTNWTITTTEFPAGPYWGARFEREHWGVFRIYIQVAAPCMRITILGRSLLFGKIPPVPKITVTTKVLSP